MRFRERGDVAGDPVVLGAVARERVPATQARPTFLPTLLPWVFIIGDSPRQRPGRANNNGALLARGAGAPQRLGDLVVRPDGSAHFYQDPVVAHGPGVFVISAGLMIFLYASRGFSRILGAGHVLWVGLLPWLWSRHDLIQSDEWLSHWIITVIVINGLSLIVDAIDVVRYVRGDRQPTVSI